MRYSFWNSKIVNKAKANHSVELSRSDDGALQNYGQQCLVLWSLWIIEDVLWEC